MIASTRSRLPKLLIPPYFFFPAFTFAHRARCAAAILFLPAADMAEREDAKVSK
jgi:hypothetical protein